MLQFVIRECNCKFLSLIAITFYCISEVFHYLWAIQNGIWITGKISNTVQWNEIIDIGFMFHFASMIYWILRLHFRKLWLVKFKMNLKIMACRRHSSASYRICVHIRPTLISYFDGRFLVPSPYHVRITLWWIHWKFRYN